MITAYYLLMKGLKEVLLVKRTAVFQEVIQVPRLLRFCDSAIKKKKYVLQCWSALNLRRGNTWVREKETT